MPLRDSPPQNTVQAPKEALQFIPAVESEGQAACNRAADASAAAEADTAATRLQALARGWRRRRQLSQRSQFGAAAAWAGLESSRPTEAAETPCVADAAVPESWAETAEPAWLIEAAERSTLSDHGWEETAVAALRRAEAAEAEMGRLRSELAAARAPRNVVGSASVAEGDGAGGSALAAPDARPRPDVAGGREAVPTAADAFAGSPVAVSAAAAPCAFSPEGTGLPAERPVLPTPSRAADAPSGVVETAPPRPRPANGRQRSATFTHAAEHAGVVPACCLLPAACCQRCRAPIERDELLRSLSECSSCDMARRRRRAVERRASREAKRACLAAAGESGAARELDVRCEGAPDRDAAASPLLRLPRRAVSRVAEALDDARAFRCCHSALLGVRVVDGGCAAVATAE